MSSSVDVTDDPVIGSVIEGDLSDIVTIPSLVAAPTDEITEDLFVNKKSFDTAKYDPIVSAREEAQHFEDQDVMERKLNASVPTKSSKIGDRVFDMMVVDASTGENSKPPNEEPASMEEALQSPEQELKKHVDVKGAISEATVIDQSTEASEKVVEFAPDEPQDSLVGAEAIVEQPVETETEVATEKTDPAMAEEAGSEVAEAEEVSQIEEPEHKKKAEEVDKTVLQESPSDEQGDTMSTSYGSEKAMEVAPGTKERTLERNKEVDPAAVKATEGCEAENTTVALSTIQTETNESDENQQIQDWAAGEIEQQIGATLRDLGQTNEEEKKEGDVEVNTHTPEVEQQVLKEAKEAREVKPAAQEVDTLDNPETSQVDGELGSTETSAKTKEEVAAIDEEGGELEPEIPTGEKEDTEVVAEVAVEPVEQSDDEAHDETGESSQMSEGEMEPEQTNSEIIEIVIVEETEKTTDAEAEVEKEADVGTETEAGKESKASVEEIDPQVLTTEIQCDAVKVDNPVGPMAIENLEKMADPLNPLSSVPRSSCDLWEGATAEASQTDTDDGTTFASLETRPDDETVGPKIEVSLAEPKEEPEEEPKESSRKSDLFEPAKKTEDLLYYARMELAKTSKLPQKDESSTKEVETEMKANIAEDCNRQPMEVDLTEVVTAKTANELGTAEQGATEVGVKAAEPVIIESKADTEVAETSAEPGANEPFVENPEADEAVVGTADEPNTAGSVIEEPKIDEAIAGRAEEPMANEPIANKSGAAVATAKAPEAGEIVIEKLTVDGAIAETANEPVTEEHAIAKDAVNTVADVVIERPKPNRITVETCDEAITEEPKIDETVGKRTGEPKTDKPIVEESAVTNTTKTTVEPGVDESAVSEQPKVDSATKTTDEPASGGAVPEKSELVQAMVAEGKQSRVVDKGADKFKKKKKKRDLVDSQKKENKKMGAAKQFYIEAEPEGETTLCGCAVS